MPFGFDLGRILGQYAGSSPQNVPQNVEQDFDQIAQNSPHDELANGIGEAFRSDQTPPFGNMVGQLFGQANRSERAGMLNQLLGALGPSVVGSLLGGGIGSGSLGNILSRFSGQQGQVQPEDVDNIDPNEVQQLADHAQNQNPGIIDHMSRFYAQNPTLVKALGGAALAIALGKMAKK